ncbi:Hsp20/alpha crystallin family protein [Candidatus Altiarchaeota archaeon]
MAPDINGLERILFRIARQLLDTTCSMTFNSSEIEPYQEYGEMEDHVVWTVEFPGVPSEDIKVRVQADSIEILVESIGYQAVQSTPRIRADDAEIMYRNGVLEVRAFKR